MLAANKPAAIDWFSFEAHFGELSASLTVLIVFLSFLVANVT